MAVNQTPGTDVDDIFLESAKIEYSKDGGSTWIDLGLADDVAITFASTKREVQPGNGTAPDRVKGSATQKATITAAMWQLSVQQICDISGGLFAYFSTAGESTPSTDELAANSTAADTFYAFEKQQYNGATPTSIAITKDPDDANVALVLNTDYRVLKVGDQWGYMFIAGDKYDATKDMEVDYTVTPAATEGYNVGGKSNQVSYQYKITNYVPTESTVAYDLYNVWTFYKGMQEGDLAFALKNKDEVDPVARIPITIGCELDPSKTAGQQLYKFERQKVSKT